jgi:hypothetical protein
VFTSDARGNLAPSGFDSRGFPNVVDSIREDAWSCEHDVRRAGSCSCSCSSSSRLSKLPAVQREVFGGSDQGRY